jgi:hypothetical protein
MIKPFYATVAALGILACAGAASAQTSSTTTTTTTWNPDEGQQLTQYWTTNKYTAVTAPGIQPQVGTELPTSVTVYPLPETINIPNREEYSYSVVNNEPVVVERSTRRVVHTWAP